MPALQRVLIVLVALFGAHHQAIAAQPAFASAEQGRALLSQSDDFVAALSPFDRAARLQTSADISEKKYLDFVGQNVVDWGTQEQQRVAAALKQVQDRLHRSGLEFPEGVVLIRTTGREEGGAAYTRGNAIVVSTEVLKTEATDAKLTKLLGHELFHIISRRDPVRRAVSCHRL